MYLHHFKYCKQFINLWNWKSMQLRLKDYGARKLWYYIVICRENMYWLLSNKLDWERTFFFPTWSYLKLGRQNEPNLHTVLELVQNICIAKSVIWLVCYYICILQCIRLWHKSATHFQTCVAKLLKCVAFCYAIYTY